MQFLMSLFVGLLLSISVSAEPLLEGRVRLESGQPAVGVQVRLFDLTNLHQSVGTTTDQTGHFTLSLPASAPGTALPQGFALGQNYPNPFNPSTVIPYQIPAAAHVRLEVFNVLGQRVATLVDAEQAAGAHKATWTATDATGQAVGAGVYIYRLVSGGATVSKRMVLIDGQAGMPATGAAGPIRAPEGAQDREYGLAVSGEGIAPYMVRDFRVEAGMAPVEVVVGAHPDDALFDTFQDDLAEAAPAPAGKAAAAPAAPTNLRFDAPTDSSCTVRWDAAEAATDYDINYRKAQGGRWTNRTHRGVRLYNTIHDLEPGTEYRWAVRAENSDGPSEWVFGPNFTTVADETDETTQEEEADGQVPAAPTNLRFDAPTDSSCTVRWDAAEGATDYDVNYRPAVGGRWTNQPHRGTGLYNTIHDLEPGTEYRWAVRAENSDGPSEWVFGPNFTTNEQPGPDLIVQLPSVSDNTLTPGQAFTLRATVQNQGDLPAAATTVRYYRSNNATITASDTQVGTDAVGALTASATHADSIALTAPMEVLTYFYGACVDPVADESNTDNNCSTAVRVTVEASGTGETAEEVEAVTEETTKEADERHLVRLIYFLPNDRPYRAEVVGWMKEDIRNVQTFFAEQMQAHGYGNMTFRFETDAQGEPLIHRVDGQYPESHYYHYSEDEKIWVWQYMHFDELEQAFDFYQNTYVVYSDSDLSWGGAIVGGYTWKATGYVDYRREASWPDHITLAHELGHAFGLSHDFRDGAYLMSYGGPSQFPDAEGTDRISACAAKLLSVHPSFNSAIPIPIEDLSPATIEQRRRLYDPEYDSSLDENSPPFPIEDPSPPTIKLLSPTEYPVGSRSVSIKFQISDSDGLHQVLLYATPNIGTPWATGGLRECRAFEGERNAVVEFDYDGSLPFAAPLFLGGTKSILSDPLHLIRVRVVDRDGNSRHMQFSLAKAGSAKASAKIAAAEPSALGVNVPYAEHSISCGVGLRREPIHVIDP